MKTRDLLVAVMCCSATWGCSQPTTITKIDRKLTVVSSQEGVARFVALQGSLRPRIQTSEIMVLHDGRSSATATIPVTHSGSDVVHVTREALAAGLSYTFKDFRVTSTTSS